MPGKEGEESVEKEGVTFDLTFVDDYNPKPDVEYFIQHEEGNGLGIMIPFYNEPVEELIVTLTDIEAAVAYLKNQDDWDKPVDLVMIADGWGFMDPSVKKMISTTFPDESLQDYLNSCSREDKEKKVIGDDSVCHNVIIQGKFQTLKYYDKDGIPRTFTAKSFSMSFHIKLDNRKKYNSHEWFFKAFLPQKKPEFMFLTDAYTRFDENVFAELIKWIQKSSDRSAASAKARVMTQEKTGIAETLNEGFMDSCLRDFQTMDIQLDAFLKKDHSL